MRWRCVVLSVCYLLLFFAVMYCVFLFFFLFLFFQAEDGIRVLVRSRGLGDVYKRQREGLRLRLFGPARVAAALGVARLGNRPVAVPCLL